MLITNVYTLFYSPGFNIPKKLFKKKKKKRFANFIIVKIFSIAYTFLRGDNKMTRG